MEIEDVDLTPYLTMPQSQAAEKLGLPVSTLSKKWKEVVGVRKWPYRYYCLPNILYYCFRHVLIHFISRVNQLDKEIMTLLHNVPKGEVRLELTLITL